MGLKRKLTGPPRKTRTRSVGDVRPEAGTDAVDPTVLKPAATQSHRTHLTQTLLMEEEAGRRLPEVKGEGGGATHRKAHRARWWRRFSSAVVCTRRPKTNPKEKQTESKRTRFRRVQTYCDVSREKNFRRFFSRAGRSTWARQDEPTEPQTDKVQNATTAADVSPVRGSGATQTDPGTVPADSPPAGLTVEGPGFTTEDVLAASEPIDEKTLLATRGPSIRIELVPPDNTASQKKEDEERRERTASQNRNHLLYGEQQLLWTARSLVQTAMSAALDQLSREQPNGSRLRTGSELELIGSVPSSLQVRF